MLTLIKDLLLPGPPVERYPFPVPKPADRIIVRAEAVRKTYGIGSSNPVEVLRGVDLTVCGGEFVAIIGQSGSGKSTLLNCLGALDTPTSGTIHIDGEEIGRLGSGGLARLRNRSIGFIFQFHHLVEEFTVLENTLVPLTIARGRPQNRDLERAKALLARVGLEAQWHKRPSQLSGGQQQRCSIVRALVTSPRLVLADEPTGNLDSRSGAEVFALMREMNKEIGVAFVMITHDDRLARAADRIMRMEDGTLQEIGDFQRQASLIS
jgi:ABC-type lipoprotein export system ATPase subunit